VVLRFVDERLLVALRSIQSGQRRLHRAQDAELAAPVLVRDALMRCPVAGDYTFADRICCWYRVLCDLVGPGSLVIDTIQRQAGKSMHAVHARVLVHLRRCGRDRGCCFGRRAQNIVAVRGYLAVCPFTVVSAVSCAMYPFRGLLTR